MHCFSLSPIKKLRQNDLKIVAAASLNLYFVQVAQTNVNKIVKLVNDVYCQNIIINVL